jgi:hypothetical protein
MNKTISRKRILPCLSIYKLTVATVVNMGLAHMSLFGQLPMVTFDNPHAPGTPAQNLPGWSVATGSASVAANKGFQNTQGLQIDQKPDQSAHLWRSIPWSQAQTTAFLDVKIKPAANQPGSDAAIVVNGAQIALQRSGIDPSKGDIWVLNGSDDNGPIIPQWQLTATSFVLNSSGTASQDFVRLTLRQDFDSKTWDLYIDGKLTAADLHFHQRPHQLDAIHFFGSDVDDVQVDDLQCLEQNMLFLDSDKDGIPDSVENAMGSNPFAKDRHLVDPSTGLTYLQRYLAQLWPDFSSPSSGTYVVPQGTIPPLALPVHTPVGSLKGNFSVGGDGSANYAIPIDLPKGTSGMEPQISLAYSSNGGSGICGLGFGISGLQVITRGSSTFAKDGAVESILMRKIDFF